MTPRPYQSNGIAKVIKGFMTWKRQLVVWPTGAGKTIMFSFLAQQCAGKVLILAHREELIDQAINKLHEATGIIASKEKAEFHASLMAKVVVASMQTMQRRLHKWPAGHFELIVADEAHHAISPSWQAVLKHFKDAKVLGVTATPDRGDRRNLGSYFESVADEILLFDLIHQGFLCPITINSIPLKIDIGRVDCSGGDYDVCELHNALDPYLEQIAWSIKEHACFRKVLVFLPLIVTSQKFTQHCIAAGLNAKHIDGLSEDRKERLHDYKESNYDVLCNAMLLTEGYDCPDVDCVVSLRPTRSRALYSQMAGRGTRIAPAKSDLLLLDFLWQHERHSLVRPAHLIASCEEEAEIVVKLAEAGGGQKELNLESLHHSAQKEREEKLRQELDSKRRREMKTIDAASYCLNVHDVDAAKFIPQFPHEVNPVSFGQKRILAEWGIDLPSVSCAGQASKVIDLLLARSKSNLATPKQLRILRQLKVPAPEKITFKQASKIMKRRFGK